jgi:hypothetical protein
MIEFNNTTSIDKLIDSSVGLNSTGNAGSGAGKVS